MPSVKFFAIKTTRRDRTVHWRFIDCAKAGKVEAKASAEFFADRWEATHPGASCKVIPMTAGEVESIRKLSQTI